MKPDWQNKSYAKTGSPAAPSTMSPKLKVGMSTLHSKISQANSNMPQASKPAVRKFADGGSVTTRSDDEIGDTNPRTGVVDPGSYDRRMQAGQENLNRLKSAVESVRSFFSREKGGEASPSNITGESGMSESDAAKKQAISGGMPFEKKEEPAVKAEEPRRKIEDYMAKPEPVAQSSAAAQDLAPAPAVQAEASVSSDNKAAIRKAKKKVFPPEPTLVNGKSFSQDVASRKEQANTAATDSMLYSNNIKPTTTPKPEKKQRLHPRTGRPY